MRVVLVSRDAEVVGIRAYIHRMVAGWEVDVGT